jgi:integral membrane protein
MMPPGETTLHADERTQLRRMRLASLLEGVTLVSLLFVAVPLKHVAGYPTATSVMGPIHGMAFLLYIWMLIQTVASADWSRAEIARAIIVAFIPFGAFANERFLRRKELALAGSASSEAKWDTSG